jgi:hypothetical protein
VLAAIITLTMEAECTFETSVRFYYTARRNNPTVDFLVGDNLKPCGLRQA